MKTLPVVLVALSLGVCGPAFAHDFWIEPSTFRPVAGDVVTASLRVGQGLQGEALPRIPELVDRFVLHGGRADSPLIGRPGSDPAGAVRAGAGLQWIGYQSRPYPVELEASKFEAYLAEEGLERVVKERARRGESAAPGRERFIRCAKALLASAGDGAAVERPLGFTLELIPKGNPYALRPGGELPLAVLFRGKPAPDVLVVAMSKEEPGKPVRARTDARGSVTLRLGRPGFWLVKAVQMEAAPAGSGVDWESWWASVTFELPGGR